MGSIDKFAAILLSSTVLWAQAPKLTLELSEILRFKSDKNSAQYKQALYGTIGDIELTYRHGYDNKYGPKPILQRELKASYQQPLFGFGSIYYALKGAKKALSHSAIALKKEEAGYRYRAYKLAIAFAKLKSQLRLIELEWELAKKRVHRLKKEHKSALVDEELVEMAEVESLELQMQKEKLEHEGKKLKREFGLISSSSIDRVSLEGIEIPSKEEFIRRDLELQDATASVEVARLRSLRSKARLRPQVSFYATYSHRYDNAALAFMEPKRNSYQYGIRVTMPLSIGGLKEHEVDQIAFLESSRGAKRLKRQKGVTYDNLHSSIEQLKAFDGLYRKIFLLKKRKYLRTKALYKKGLVGQEQLDEAKLSYAQAKYKQRQNQLLLKEELLELIKGEL